MACPQSRSCTYCYKIADQDVDLRSLVLYTQLPELWDAFVEVVSLNPPGSEGSYNLMALPLVTPTALLQDSRSSLMYFLARKNSELYKMRIKAAKGG